MRLRTRGDGLQPNERIDDRSECVPIYIDEDNHNWIAVADIQRRLDRMMDAANLKSGGFIVDAYAILLQEAVQSENIQPTWSSDVLGIGYRHITNVYTSADTIVYVSCTRCCDSDSK